MNSIKEFFKGFILSIGFFTIFRIPVQIKNITNDTYRFLALTIPFNGILLASSLILIFIFLSYFLPVTHSAIISSVAYFALYGFLHLEAFVDIVDAIYASHSGKDTYAILKDSHIGAIGAIAIFCFIIVKITLFVYLLIHHKYLIIFIITFLSRLSATWLIYGYDFHPKSKFILSMKKSILKKDMIILFLFVALLSLLFKSVHLLVLMLLFSWELKNYLIKKIGFLNGDGLGFVIEVNEVLLIFVYLVIFKVLD